MQGRVPASTLSGIAQDSRMKAVSFALAVCKTLSVAGCCADGRHPATSAIMISPTAVRIDLFLRSPSRLSQSTNGKPVSRMNRAERKGDNRRLPTTPSAGHRKAPIVPPTIIPKNAPIVAAAM